jgi:hypothetical protein
MLQRRSAEPPVRLQTLRQCREVLTTEHDMSMLPARERQAEVIDPVIEWHTRNADAVIAHLGEIGQPSPTWRVLLPEDDVALGSIERPPGAGPPFPTSAGYRRQSSGRRSRISSKLASGRRPGVLFNRGTTSPSQPLPVDPGAGAREAISLRREPRILFAGIGSGGY